MTPRCRPKEPFHFNVSERLKRRDSKRSNEKPCNWISFDVAKNLYDSTKRTNILYNRWLNVVSSFQSYISKPLHLAGTTSLTKHFSSRLALDARLSISCSRACSNEGEKVLVYAATKSPLQTSPRSINYPKV